MTAPLKFVGDYRLFAPLQQFSEQKPTNPMQYKIGIKNYRPPILGSNLGSKPSHSVVRGAADHTVILYK